MYILAGESKAIRMKMLPWGWGRWLLFRVLLSNVPAFPGCGVAGIYFDWCITIGPVHTKLGDFVKFGLQFMTLWSNWG